HEKFDGIGFPTSQTCNVRSLVGPDRHRHYRLEGQRGSPQRLRLDGFTFVVMWGVAIATLRHLLDQILPASYSVDPVAEDRACETEILQRVKISNRATPKACAPSFMGESSWNQLQHLPKILISVENTLLNGIFFGMSDGRR